MQGDQPKIGRGLPARRGKRCAHQGRKYQHNSLFKPSSCNICECDDGNVECEQIQCDVLMCPVQVTPEGACCPICDDRTQPGDRPADIQGTVPKNFSIQNSRVVDCMRELRSILNNLQITKTNPKTGKQAF